MRRRPAAPSVATALAAAAAITLVAGLAAPPALAFSTPNDTLFSHQWGMQLIGAPQAWAAGAVGAGVKIGIVDSGIDLGHEDLQGKVVASTSCVGAPNPNPDNCHGSAQDDNGHGTHVAGIAAANTNNGKGVAGVAPGAQLVIARALVGDASGSASGDGNSIIAGIEWVMSHGAQVVNLSLGDNSGISSLTGSTLTQEIDKAWNTNHVIVVVAAGNNGPLFGSEYANSQAVVVTATDRNDHIPGYANGDNSLVASARWGMAAPGGAGTDTADTCKNAPNDIVSTFGYINNPAQSNGSFHEYGCLAGTSMAAPHVTGAAAVLLGLGVPYNQVPDRLVSTAKAIGSSGAGHGRLDLAKAVAGLGPAPRPGVTTTAGASPSTSHRTSPTGRGPSAPVARGASPTTAAAGSAARPSTTAAPAISEAGPRVEAATVHRTVHRAHRRPWAAVALGVIAVAGVGAFAVRRRRAIR